MEKGFEVTIPIKESKIIFTLGKAHIEPTPLKEICSYCGQRSKTKNEAHFSKPFSKLEKAWVLCRNLGILALGAAYFYFITHSTWYGNASQDIHNLVKVGLLILLFCLVWIIRIFQNGKGDRKFYLLTYHLCDLCAQRNKRLNIILYSLGALTSLWLVFFLIATSMIWTTMSLILKIIWLLSCPISISLVWGLYRLSVHWRGFEVRALKDRPGFLLKFYDHVVGKKCVTVK